MQHLQDNASDFATKGGLNPTIAKTMRLGISPTTLKTVSRRFGLPGLALSLGISGYETYDDFKNKRGFLVMKNKNTCCKYATRKI